MLSPFSSRDFLGLCLTCKPHTLSGRQRWGRGHEYSGVTYHHCAGLCLTLSSACLWCGHLPMYFIMTQTPSGSTGWLTPLVLPGDTESFGALPHCCGASLLSASLPPALRSRGPKEHPDESQDRLLHSWIFVPIWGRFEAAPGEEAPSQYRCHLLSCFHSNPLLSFLLGGQIGGC